MNTIDYESIWRQSLVHVTDEFTLPPIVLQAGEAIIGTLAISAFPRARRKQRIPSMFVPL